MNVTSISHIRTWKDIKDHITVHAGELEYLDEYEGLDNFLGSGAYGKVWKIKGKELTIKVTTSQDEANIASELEKIEPYGFLKIYKTINIHSDPLTQIRIQEMCYKANMKQGDFLSVSYIQDLIYKKLERGEDYSSLETLRNDLKKQAGREFYPDMDFLSKIYDMLIGAKRDLDKIGFALSEFGYLDIHGNNIMEDKEGNFVLVDF
jgi:hypothetical protein